MNLISPKHSEKVVNSIRWFPNAIYPSRVRLSFLKAPYGNTALYTPLRFITGTTFYIPWFGQCTTFDSNVCVYIVSRRNCYENKGIRFQCFYGFKKHSKTFWIFTPFPYLSTSWSNASSSPQLVVPSETPPSFQENSGWLTQIPFSQRPLSLASSCALSHCHGYKVLFFPWLLKTCITSLLIVTKALNTGTCLYMLWTGLACLNLLWTGNAINWAPVWCDICEPRLFSFLDASLIFISNS